MSLFQKSVINKYIKNLSESTIEIAFQKFKQFYGNYQRIENIRLLKEENYQEGFLREIFVQVLGYKINPDENYNLTTEFKNLTDARKADGAILRNGNAIGVIELKSTKTTDLESITEQAFSYKNHQPSCRYIITSNFERIRFYIDNATDFEEFNLFKLNEENFKILYLILSKESIFFDIPLKLKNESVLHEENISKQLYQDYSQFKRKIFNNIVKNNPQYDKLILFKKSQKLLDRLLFILFAEDTGLIPPNAISTIVEHWKKLQELEAYQPLYRRFKLFFEHLDKGHKYKNYELPPYNGGLFAPDDILNNIKIDDEILKDDSLKLSSYDFNTDIDVNILGHIFEHSLNEIEEITAEIQGEPIIKKQTKRKKEGIFYTPKYITQYIIENTIGTLCKDKKEELCINDIDIDDTCFNKSKSAGSVVRLSKKGEELVKKLEEYKEWLLSLKILDPACGSGAFLIQALNFLIAEHKSIWDIETELSCGQLSLFDIDKAVLENNLYGVDINEESVEIARLSLWLRTAKKGRQLSDLNSNIKCGNSLIDDPEVAGDKAFDWNKEFPEIMQNGGFDVVIGNPPYVQVTKYQDYYLNRFETANCGDLYAYFIEKGIKLLKINAAFSFIVPSLFIKGLNYSSLRNFLLQNVDIQEILDKGDGVFQDVQMPTAILNIRKWKNTEQNWNKFIPGSKIITKIEYQSTCIKNFSKIQRGLEIGKDKVSEVGSVPILTGDVIGRYIIYKNKYISSETYNQFRKDEFYFSGQRVVIRETGNRITAFYTEESIQQNRSLYSIKIIKDYFSPFYLLSIINSSLIQFYYRSKFTANTDVFPKIRIAQVKEIPIKEISKELQLPFIAKSDQMLELNKQLQEKKNRLLRRVKDNLEVEKISKKLESFYNYDFKTFVSELNKQKIQLSLVQQDEWEEYFESYKAEINNLQTQISQTDKEIDRMVYELYGLTEDEIKIVESSF